MHKYVIWCSYNHKKCQKSLLITHSQITPLKIKCPPPPVGHMPDVGNHWSNLLTSWMIIILLIVTTLYTRTPGLILYLFFASFYPYIHLSYASNPYSGNHHFTLGFYVIITVLTWNLVYINFKWMWHYFVRKWFFILE